MNKGTASATGRSGVVIIRKAIGPMLATSLALAACAPAVESAPDPVEQVSGTRILDAAQADRLLAAKGITLQWIGWNQRGSVNIRKVGDDILLTGAQAAPDGPGRLYVDGKVTEIGADYFILDGEVRITDAPDVGRKCSQDKQWRFAITQQRPYWRLREFEWCDGLTDYVDIYF